MSIFCRFDSLNNRYNDTLCLNRIIIKSQIKSIMLETIFGISAGILTSIRLLPQVYKSVKIKETREISLLLLIFLFFQAILLLCYGITKPDMFIFYMNISPLICSVILLHLKHKYSNEDSQNWMSKDNTGYFSRHSARHSLYYFYKRLF